MEFLLCVYLIALVVIIIPFNQSISVKVFTYFSLVSIFLTYVLLIKADYPYIDFFSLLDDLTDEELIKFMVYELEMVISANVGAIFYRLFMIRRSHAKIFKPMNMKHARTVFSGKYFLIGLLLVVYILAIIEYQYTGLLKRDLYLPTYLTIGKSLFTLLSIFISYQAGVNFSSSKFSSGSLLFFIMILFFAVGSRMLMLLPIIFLLGTYSNGSFNYWKLIILGAISALGGVVALQVRGFEAHGFIPYFNTLFTQGIDIQKIHYLFDYTFIFGNVIGAYVANINESGIKNLLINLNPLPGSMVGWYEIKDNLRVNEFAPFNAVGELKSSGFIAYFYAFISGIVMMIGSSIGKENKKILMLTTVLSILFIGHYYQYNLRSATRYLYYIILLVATYKLYKYLKIFLKNKIIG